MYKQFSNIHIDMSMVIGGAQIQLRTFKALRYLDNIQD